MFDNVKDVRVLLANAGTGKTRRMIEEIAGELTERRPEEIAFVTFTRKGAEEGLSRICNKLLLDASDLPYFRTLHSLTFHALGLKPIQMFSRLDQKTFNKKYGYNLNRAEVSSGGGRVIATLDSQYLDYYDLERSGALTSKQIADINIEMVYYRQLVHDYEEFKADMCLIDFFDCLIRYVREGDSLPVKVAYIDECQDITALQWKVIDKAFANAEKIVMAGDEQQSIYVYSGARPDYLINFAKKYPVEYLSRSYRIPNSVYRLAKAVTDSIGNKTDKPFEFMEGNPEGSVNMLTDIDNLKALVSCPDLQRKTSTWYILARNNCFLPRAEEMLESAVIPYWNAEGFFMGGEVMRRLNEYYNYRKSGYRDSEKRRTFMERYGITDFNNPICESRLFNEDRKYVYEAYLERYGFNKLKEMTKWYPQILVSTIHHVKGGEADNVAILLDSTRRTDCNVYNDIDEELRILYVGITRAKENLYLIEGCNGGMYNDIVSTIRSEFSV